MANVSKELVKYLTAVMKDPKANAARKDKAAVQLLKYVTAKNKLRLRKMQIVSSKASKKESLARSTEVKRTQELKLERVRVRVEARREQKKNKEKRPGKKQVKNAESEAVATGSEWGALIPKASVVDIHSAKKKAL